MYCRGGLSCASRTLRTTCRELPSQGDQQNVVGNVTDANWVACCVKWQCVRYLSLRYVNTYAHSRSGEQYDMICRNRLACHFTVIPHSPLFACRTMLVNMEYERNADSSGLLELEPRSPSLRLHLASPVVTFSSTFLRQGTPLLGRSDLLHYEPAYTPSIAAILLMRLPPRHLRAKA